MSLSMLQRKPDSGLGNIRSSPADPSRNIDWILLVGQVLLTTIGCFVVYSATRTLAGIDPYNFVTRQVMFAIVAAAVMFLVMTLDYEWLHDHWRVLYFFTVVLLALLLILGKLSGEDLISFDIGPINIQPAEFAKVTVLLGIAAYVADEESEKVTYARFLGALILVGVPAVMVLAQPDLGGATVLLACAMGVLLVAGAKIVYILTISILSVATLGAAYLSGFVNDYQLERIKVFFDQDNPELRDEVFQVRNAIRAAGTGGWFGKGWLQGDLINGRDVPVVWADFPFAAVGRAVRPRRRRHAAAAVRHRALPHLAHRRAVEGHVRHLHLCWGIHDVALAAVPERRDDNRDHARDGSPDAVHLIWRVGPDHLLRHLRAGPERPHAPHALGRAARWPALTGGGVR